jgi:NADH-quinone oxidoreductase subunit L
MMLSALFLVPLLPIVGFVLIALGGGRMGRRSLALAGTLPTAAAAAVAFGIAIAFLVSPPAGDAYSQVLWTWVSVDGFMPQVALYLDPLSLVMMLVVTFVALLILVYSTEFMKEEEGYRRFFAYMNLFVASMLILVLADDFLFLLVGWEGVGLSSYLLIGFWYREPANGAAARKAFIVTRVGDTALVVGLLLLFTQLGTLNIQNTMDLAQNSWAPGSAIAAAAALLVLGGAVGKSAQLPLQTWLPDAMAGPTPVSALIHAATMVTAGVYLVARTHVLFELSPTVQLTVAVIGAVTLLYAGLSALAQTDIKRVLAYSTISQIGYMFLALGVGAWSAAIFHLMVHAFFKALLFLSAGLVIKAMGGEHDIRKMGGLRRDLPVVFWAFLIGSASLAAVPVVTAGFYSKDLIIGYALASEQGGLWLWIAAVVGALLTSLYAFRLVFVVFFGPRGEASDQTPPAPRFGRAVLVPVLALAALSIGVGWMQLPDNWSTVQRFTDFMEPVLPLPDVKTSGFASSVLPQVLVMLISLAGIRIAYTLFSTRPTMVRRLAASPNFQRVAGLALEGWGFDRLYTAAFVRPFLWLARRGKDDFIDAGFSTVAWSATRLSALLSRTQTGRVRYYVAVAAFGAVLFVALGIFR